MLKHCTVIIHIENLLVSRLSSLFALFYIVIFYENPLQGCHFPRKKLFRGTRNKRNFLFIPKEFRLFEIPFRAILRNSDPFRGK
jgi:hypothetical protein